MAQLTRKNIKLFAGNSANNQTGKVGTYKLGSAGVVFSKDPAVIQAGEWENGMANTLQSDYAPFLEEYNSIIYCMSYFLKQLAQTGIMQYDASEEYFENSYCVSVVDGLLYKSLQGTSETPNINHEPSASPTYWELQDFTQKSSRNIGEIVQSTIPLTDAGLHLLDGELILAGGSYDAFYLHMKDLYDGGLYPDLFTSEANWQASVSTYGVCGKFVFEDGVSVRIPKIFGFTEGTINPTDLGNLTEAGLPNITGGVNNVAFDSYNTSNVDGAFDSITNVSDATGSTSSAERYCNFTFSASASNSIYGNSTTVQPQSIKVLYYICVATSVKTDVAVDIDNIMTDLSALQHGTTAIFDTLDNTAKNNIIAFVGLKKIIEFDIEDSDTEIIINNITNADLHKFLFANLEVNQASYLCYQLSADNGKTWLSDTKYFDAGITFKSNNYANNAFTDNSSFGILTNDGAGFLMQPNDGNSCFGEVNFNDLMNSSLSKKANINFTYNTETSANGIQGFYIACAGYYNKVSCNAIRFFLSSGTFKKGKIKYYVMN